MELPAPQDAVARPPRRGRVLSIPRLPASRFLMAPIAAVVAFLLGSFDAVAAERAKPAPSWRDQPRTATAVDAVADWLRQQPGGPALARQWADAIQSAPRPARLGPELVRIVALADGRLASLASAPDDAPPAWLDSLGDAAPSFRLAIADQLADAERYDACLAWTGVDQDPYAPVYSPALAQYLRAISHRMTVSDKQASKSFKRGADDSDSLGPAREWVVAALERELDAKPEPLPTVARRMRDVERRLALEEPGKTTQERQQTILDELDELIKKLEEQRKRQQQMAAASQGGAGGEPGEAAEESRPSELKGPGEVDRKRLVAGDAWGALPPAERERLTQAISRDFPPHYRGLIEDYFRTLAGQEGAAADESAEESEESDQPDP